MDYDLQGAKGPLEAAKFEQLKVLLSYTSPDVVALHTVLQEAGKNAGAPLAQTALAMNMYYAYQPLDDRLGSALLSRYPIQQAACIFDEKSQATMGMSLQLLVEGRNYTVLVVRPPTAAVARVTAATVQAQLKALGGSDYVVLASFSPALGGQAVSGGLDEGGVGPIGVAPEPGHLPLHTAAGASRLHSAFPQAAGRIRERRGGALAPGDGSVSEHLPIEVTLRR